MVESLEREIRELRSLYWHPKRDPDGRAFAPLADAYRRAGQHEQALEALDDGLDRLPEYATGHLVAAWVHRDGGDVARAEAAFRRVLELDPDNARGLLGLGRLQVSAGRVAAGRPLVHRALELDPLLEAEESVPDALIDGEGGFDGVAEAHTDPVEAHAVDTDEPVMDVAVVAPEADPPVSDDEEIVDLDAFAPDSALDLGEAARGDDPADSDLDDDAFFDLTALAPDVEEPAAEDDEMADLAALAPDAEESAAEDDEMLDLAALAPDAEEPAAEDDEMLDLAALAPDAEEPAAEDDEMLDLAALAPDVEEPAAEDAEMLDLAALAPDEEEPAAEDDEMLDLAALAPGPEAAGELSAEVEPDAEEEPVADLSALAPESDEGESDGEEMMELGALAPEPESSERRGAGPLPTRTLAELYARQGLTHEALEVYRILADRAPDDASLRVRIAELRAEADGEAPVVDIQDTEDEPHDELVPTAPDPSPEEPTPFGWAGDAGAAEEEAGPAEPPVKEYFSSLLNWRGDASGGGASET